MPVPRYPAKWINFRRTNSEWSLIQPTLPSPAGPRFGKICCNFFRKFMTKISGVQSLNPDFCTTSCADWTDVNLKMSTQTKLIMPIRQSKIIWQCKWPNLVTKFVTYASGATWWPTFEPIQVVPLGGQICTSWKGHHLVAKFLQNTSLSALGCN